MGDRGNIKLVFEEEKEIYFYSHWTGSRLKEILKDALIRGKGSWDDSEYLARIIFCEMVKDNVLDETGYGISPYQGDGNVEATVIMEDNIVFDTADNKITFEEFIE